MSICGLNIKEKLVVLAFWSFKEHWLHVCKSQITNVMGLGVAAIRKQNYSLWRVPSSADDLFSLFVGWIEVWTTPTGNNTIQLKAKYWNLIKAITNDSHST